MEVRPATENDLPAIAAIYNEAIAATTATFDTEPKSLADRAAWFKTHGERHPVIVAVKDGKVAGWGGLSTWSDRCAYDATAENSVYVAADERGNGVGRVVLAELVRLARRLEMHTIIARIADGNPASERLHTAAGFTKVGTMREVGRKFGKLIDVHMYQLML